MTGRTRPSSHRFCAGLEPLLDPRTTRRVERVDHLEVWGPVVGDA